VRVVPVTVATHPPPLPEVREARRERRLAAGLAALGVVVFGIGWFLDPYESNGQPRMRGTHRQLGLPPCGLHVLTGRGCPSCGMTTTFSLLAHGDPVAAWQTNWAGCLIAVMAGFATVWFLLVAGGLPPGRFTVDEVVKAIAISGATLAAGRWIVITCFGDW
jgi:hypothetical protein